VSEAFEEIWEKVHKPLSGNKKGYKKGFKDCFMEYVVRGESATKKLAYLKCEVERLWLSSCVQQKKIDELEKKLAEAVELIDCTSDRWGNCKCKSCAFLDSLEEKAAQGE
jgi:hypothetical protein